MNSATQQEHREHKMHSGELARFMAEEIIDQYENVQIEHLPRMRQVVADNDDEALCHLIGHNWSHLTGRASTSLGKPVPYAKSPGQQTRFRTRVEVKLMSLLKKHFSDVN
jgi:hypothetical protein